MSITPAMQPNLSRVFVLVALGACASEPATIHHGTTGSGSDDDPGTDAGAPVGSGSSAQPPAPGTLYGTVLDERSDQINFSTGEPVHTHAGPAIDLGAGGCPVVYKYAYLEDQNDPQFGRQTSINPLAWNVTSQVGSLDDTATAYRVRLDDGSIALDWTPTSPDGTGLYTVRLYRNGNPSLSALGDHTGKMYVDVRFKDLEGNETVDTACWENHPMAAPLEVDALATGDLFTWSLPAHSPISTAIDTASIDATAEEQVGASVYAQTIVQHTAEPVTLHLDHSAITGTASETEFSEAILVSSTQVTIDCSTASCLERAIPAASTTSSSGALTATWNMHVVDAVSGAIVCHNPDGTAPASAIDGCILPARAANEAPHAYQLVIAMSGAQSIDPDSTFTKLNGEQTISSSAGVTTSFTGVVANAWTNCLARTLPNGEKLCSNQLLYNYIDALDLAQLAFGPLQLTFETAPDSSASLESIAAYATSSLSIGAQSWNAGDAGFAD